MKRFIIFFLIILSNALFTSQVKAQTKLPQLASERILGTVKYYRWRYNDFMNRHPNLVEPDAKHIPDYYIDYGEKYASRFTNELYPKLSKKGKKWLIKARYNLQIMIENRCIKNKLEFAKLEENPKDFRAFAFKTHPIAYMDAGLAKLPLSDLIKIGLTPDIKDILSKNGSTQIISISGKLGKSYLKQVFQLIRQTQKLICKAARNENFSEVEQTVIFVEGLSNVEVKLIRLITRDFRNIRREIQFKLSHKEGSENWKKLLLRIKKL